MTNFVAPRGVCFFAYNNDQIDYVELALLASMYVKKHLKLPVCLITDQGSSAWLHESKDISLIEENIDYIMETTEELPSNKRRHFDSPWTEFTTQFSNGNKHNIYEYSPFEETLLLDIDYIVKNNFLLSAFENPDNVSMYSEAIDCKNDLPLQGDRRLFDIGIKMWWSTVIYFDRSDKSKLFFDTWAHIADNYQFYRYLYNFPGNVFRTDYCVSIAVHILNGMMESNTIGNFNGIPMQNMSQKDDIVKINNSQDWILLAVNQLENWKALPVKQSNLDLHAMNKRALSRSYSQLVEMLQNE